MSLHTLWLSSSQRANKTMQNTLDIEADTPDSHGKHGLHTTWSRSLTSGLPCELQPYLSQLEYARALSSINDICKAVPLMYRVFCLANGKSVHNSVDKALDPWRAKGLQVSFIPGMTGSVGNDGVGFNIIRVQFPCVDRVFDPTCSLHKVSSESDHSRGRMIEAATLAASCLKSEQFPSARKETRVKSVHFGEEDMREVCIYSGCT